MLVGDDRSDISRPEHRLLLRLTRQHPDVALFTSQVNLNSDTGEIISAELLRYSRGRRRTIATFRSEQPDPRGQLRRLLTAVLQNEGNRQLQRR
jgi:hypothetical protein